MAKKKVLGGGRAGSESHAGKKVSGEVTRAEYNVSPQQFVEVWQTSESAAEAADRLGMPKSIAHARASSYRQSGVKLKSMPRGKARGLDVEELNRFIEEVGRRGHVPPSRKASKTQVQADPANVRNVVSRVLERFEHAKD